MPDSRLHIAVGVIFSHEKDKVLIAKRPDNVHQGGLWEFPGGKCQDGEDVVLALRRELFEELNLGDWMEGNNKIASEQAEFFEPNSGEDDVRH